MLEFLTENWKLIAIIGCIVIEAIILLIAKKRPEVVDNSILVRICEWVDLAEKKFLKGEDKLSFVLEEAKKYLGDKFVQKDVISMVEYVLTLPEKKEK